MLPEYKRVKVTAPHCPVCKEKLRGDNSMINPWRCLCGIWINKAPYGEMPDYKPTKKEYVKKTNRQSDN